MCGEIDEEGSAQADLLQRFLLRASAVVTRASAPSDGTNPNLNAYLDRLFADVLKRCVDDLGTTEYAESTESTDPAEAYRRLAMQSAVMARLAGYLAGHAALNEDPLRRVMEATLLGYGEADSVARGPANDHGHSH